MIKRENSVLLSETGLSALKIGIGLYYIVQADKEALIEADLGISEQV